MKSSPLFLTGQSRILAGLISLAAFFFVATDASAVVSLVFSGPKTTTFPQQGLVAHGEINENPIFDQFGTSMTHPFDGSIGGVYTELTSTDGFNFTDGSELAFTTTPVASYQASAAAGHGLSSIGVTADDSNTIWLAARGFTLDTLSPTDYVFNTSTLIETRLYRHGQWVLYEETAPNTYQEILAYDEVVLTLDIDFNSGLITATGTGTPWIGPSGLLPLFNATLSAGSVMPVATDGSTTEGRYAIFPTNANDFEIVPEPSRMIFAFLGFAGVLFRRRRA